MLALRVALAEFIYNIVRRLVPDSLAAVDTRGPFTFSLGGGTSSSYLSLRLPQGLLELVLC